MFKWTLRLVLIGLLGFTGASLYSFHRAGYFSLPDVPDGALLVSFKNGLRGMVVGIEVDDPNLAESPAIFRRLSQSDRTRRFIGYPAEVPVWFEDAWSTCTPPTDTERAELYRSFSEEVKRSVQGARFDAICRLDVDGQMMVRGVIFSVPRL